ncbi:MAG: LysM peptidoglycan-binding domain-containing protein, partial [Phycisphaerae bacterium]|nr:LysM peptidoglycan-binding domain-containing protein [Phycisphaerae bacterium]
MRTDYKIGIAAALVLVALAVGYFIFADDKPEATEDTQQLTGTQDDARERNRWPQEEASDQPTLRGPGEGVTPRVVPRVVEAGDATDETARIPDAPAAGETPPARLAQPGYVRTADTVMARETSPPATVTTETPRVGAAEAAAPPVGWTTYVVKEGDAGFWGISLKVYRHGKHWPIIANANPDADPRRLRAGQILKIPPLPQRTAIRPAAEQYGQLTPTIGGKNIYVVKEGDAGFWGISQRLFGDGKYWKLIEDENPGLDSTSLKPGQKLIIPPKPSTTTVERLPVRGEDGATYTVQSGDTLSAISQRHYGNSRYWALIQQ